MTAEEIVKAKWPDARISQFGYLNGLVHVVTNERGSVRYKSAQWKTANEAWSDAAQRIQRDPVEQEGKCES